MQIALIVLVVVLWFLLGHATRLLYAITSGGYYQGFLRNAYCYLLAPIAAIRFMFDGVPGMIANCFKGRSTDAASRG